MSAFALRKRLFNSQGAIASPRLDAADETDVLLSASDSVESSKTRAPKKARKGPKSQPTPNHEIEPSIALEGPSAGGQLTNENIDIDPASALSGTSSPSEDEEVLIQQVKASPVQFSNFKHSKNNYQRHKDGRLSIKLSDGERLVILGSYGLLIKSGGVTINGATLRGSQKVHWVDAPHCHALPVIRCINSAALELHPHPSAAGLRSLAKLSPQFRRLWNESNPASGGQAILSHSTFQILYTSADGPKKIPLQDLVSPPEWNREVAKLVDLSKSKSCSFMIAGPKSSGKSTFGKVLVNRLLADRSNNTNPVGSRGVVVLDLDPGQPEYCVAGQVALVSLYEPVLSPSFCRPQPNSQCRIVRSHALASISPASDPELYLEAAMDLLTHYRNSLGSYPLVINTPGWIQGTGLDLLTSLITTLRPTEVVYMSESGPAEVVEALQESCKVAKFSALPSQASQLSSRTAAHFRSMQTMSYFHSERTDDIAPECYVRWNTKPLTTIPPYQVGYTGSNRGIFGIMCYDYQAPLDLLADAINGTVLAVVAVQSPKAFRRSAERAESSVEQDDNGATTDMMDIDDNDNKPQDSVTPSFSSLEKKIITTTPEGIPFIDTSNGITLDPKYSHSIGLALVRGIDIENGVLQILTPLDLGSIEALNTCEEEIVLVSGKFDAPTWAYTEDFYFRARGEADEGTDPGVLVENGDDVSESGVDDSTGPTDANSVPWIEALHGNQKRGVGSKVWRVRRDLGRAGNATD